MELMNGTSITLMILGSFLLGGVIGYWLKYYLDLQKK